MQNIKTLVKIIIQQEGRYLTAKEISEKSEISLFTLYKAFPEGLEKECHDLGFVKSPKYTKASLESILENYIQDQGRAVSAFEIANVLKISRATLRKFDIDIYVLNSKLGFEKEKLVPSMAGYNKGFVKENKQKYVLKKRYKTTGYLIEESLSIIEQFGQYCSAEFLARKLGISQNLFSYRNINIGDLNLSLGFIRNNRCFEIEMKNLLEEIFEDKEIIGQKWFKDCLSDLRNKLYFDFYIPHIRTLVEADGPCHFDVKHPWYTEKVIRRDLLKAEYCKNNNLTLVRIPYRNNLNKEYILQYLSGIPL